MGDIKNQIYKEALSASALKKVLASSGDDIARLLKKAPTKLSKMRKSRKAAKDLAKRMARSNADKSIESVKNVDDVIRAVSRKNNLNWFEAKKLVEKNMHTSGTGTIFGDAGLGLLKKIKPLRRPIEDFQGNYMQKLVDIDMKAGDTLQKKFPKKLSNFFGNEVKVRSGDVTHHFKTNQLTAPYIKTKDKVLPLVGGMTIANKLYPNEENKRDANGPPKGR